jgi:hypothetical protein
MLGAGVGSSRARGVRPAGEAALKVGDAKRAAIGAMTRAGAL